MAMDDSNSSLDDHSDEDIASLREARIALARTQLDAGLPCIPELEALLTALTPKVKSIHGTGLIPFLRDLKYDVDSIEAILQELQPPTPQDVTGASKQEIGRAELDAIWKRLEPRTTGVYHTTTRWQALRRCANLVAVKCTFQGSARDDRRAAVLERGLQTNHEKLHMHRVIKEQAKAEVTVVDGGAGWLELRWISADRLARQMADEGWSWGEYELGDVVDRDEWEDIPFVKQVRRAVAAARLNRHEYRIPAIRLVLPNLARGTNRDVDVLLDQLPRIDPGVELVVEDATSAFLTQPAPCLTDTIRNLVGDSLQVLTDTLNLEHTVLVDLISDLTHADLTPQPWQSRTTRAQIAEENAQPGGVMASLLYPLLQGRRLVCTHAAAEHLHEMLKTVGTATERERGRLLVPYHAACTGAGADALRARFSALSKHALPADLQFPMEVLPADDVWDADRVQRLVEDGGNNALPPVALDIVRRGLLKSSKLSTYMHGWREGIVTLTSNKEIRAHMKTWVEAGRRADDERGPQIYCVDVTRNLLAKSAMPPPGWGVCGGSEETDELKEDENAAVDVLPQD